MWYRIGRVAGFLWIIALAIIFSSTWLQTMRDPDEPKTADFIHFYAAGRIAQEYGYTKIYDLDLQQAIQNQVRGIDTDLILIYNHPPYFVPVLTWMVDDDYIASFTRWVLLLLCVFIVSIYCLIQSLYKEETRSMRLMVAGGVLTFMPVFISLWQGQDTGFLFLGLVLWCVGMLKKNDWLAAAGLTLISVRPHLCIALVLPFLFKYRSVFWRFVVFAALAGIYSLLLIGVQGILDFINLLKISAQRVGYGMNPQSMPNLTGVLYRSLHFLDANFLNSLSWIIFVIGIILIILLWVRSTTINEPLLGLTILIAAMFAPHLHIHDLAILALPLLFALRTREAQQIAPLACMILPAASSIFLSGRIIGSLEFFVPYVVSIALAWRLASRMRLEA